MRVFDGQLVRARRVALGMRREELAHKIGRSYPIVSKYEANKCMPSADSLGRLADALGCESDDLFSRSTDELAEV